MSSSARSVNEVILIGWVANDPILKESKTGQNLVVFNLATKRIWATKESERKEEIAYHKMAVWGRLADKADKVIEKGIKLYIRGYLHNRTIQIAGEEKPRIITEVVLNDFLILDKRKIKIDEESVADNEDICLDDAQQETY